MLPVIISHNFKVLPTSYLPYTDAIATKVKTKCLHITIFQEALRIYKVTQFIFPPTLSWDYLTTMGAAVFYQSLVVSEQSDTLSEVFTKCLACNMLGPTSDNLEADVLFLACKHMQIGSSIFHDLGLHPPLRLEVRVVYILIEDFLANVDY